LNGKNERTGVIIVEELLFISRKMAESEDLDYIVDAIDRRSALMAEYDRLKANNSYFAEGLEKNRARIKKMVDEIISLDSVTNRTLMELREDVKKHLEGATAKRRVLQYTNSAISTAGSYMDFKK
jgi:hypothetical protein